MKTPQPYVSTYTVDEWRGVTLCGSAQVEYIPPGDARRPACDPDPEAPLMRVYLHSGSMRRYHCANHDEGHSYEQEVISEGEMGGAPAWIIETENGGKDCDGQHARYWEGYSTGGLEEGAWFSPSTETKAEVYDQYARMAGY